MTSSVGVSPCDCSNIHTTCSCLGNGNFYEEITLSDEYTTELLISTTEDALPDYAACFDCDEESEGCEALISGQGCACSAFRNLSTEELSYSIRKFKYKFTFGLDGDGDPIAIPGYLKIFWTERFTPEGGGSPTDTAKTWEHAVGDSPVTESDTYEVDVPTTDGTTTIVNIRMTAEEGCEPALMDEGDDTCDPDTDDCSGHYGGCC